MARLDRVLRVVAGQLKHHERLVVGILFQRKAVIDKEARVALSAVRVEDLGVLVQRLQRSDQKAALLLRIRPLGFARSPMIQHVRHRHQTIRLHVVNHQAKNARNHHQPRPNEILQRKPRKRRHRAANRFILEPQTLQPIVDLLNRHAARQLTALLAIEKQRNRLEFARQNRNINVPIARAALLSLLQQVRRQIRMFAAQLHFAADDGLPNLRRLRHVRRHDIIVRNEANVLVLFAARHRVNGTIFGRVKFEV
mmetsp:Transcript_18371/g.29110  ORF Transcript_18371/g.29110 Transcript_18371/m.29110 type:complete len:253 (-) Transcript_18371:851-1609(-)